METRKVASRCASGARQPGAGPGAAGPPGPVTQVVTGTEFCILEGLEPEKRQQLFVPKRSEVGFKPGSGHLVFTIFLK